MGRHSHSDALHASSTISGAGKPRGALHSQQAVLTQNNQTRTTAALRLRPKARRPPAPFVRPRADAAECTAVCTHTPTHTHTHAHAHAPAPAPAHAHARAGTNPTARSVRVARPTAPLQPPPRPPHTAALPPDRESPPTASRPVCAGRTNAQPTTHGRKVQRRMLMHASATAPRPSQRCSSRGNSWERFENFFLTKHQQSTHESGSDDAGVPQMTATR